MCIEFYGLVISIHLLDLLSYAIETTGLRATEIALIHYFFFKKKNKIHVSKRPEIVLHRIACLNELKQISEMNVSDTLAEVHNANCVLYCIHCTKSTFLSRS